MIASPALGWAPPKETMGGLANVSIVSGTGFSKLGVCIRVVSCMDSRAVRDPATNASPIDLQVSPATTPPPSCFRRRLRPKALPVALLAPGLGDLLLRTNRPSLLAGPGHLGTCP
jgi:hypothetical protein